MKDNSQLISASADRGSCGRRLAPRCVATAAAAVIVQAGLVAAAWAAEQPPSFDSKTRTLSSVDLVVLPAVDTKPFLEEDLMREASREIGPTRFAVVLESEYTPERSGTWETLGDGARVWRLRVVSPGAINVHLGLTTFELPPGARLWVYDPAADLVHGPYTAKNRSRHGRLFTPMVLGDEIVIELEVPAAVAFEPRLVIGQVNHGYRAFGEPRPKASGDQGSCNIDVVCAEADSWAPQIRSVAHYTVSAGGGFINLCTGTLVNNTDQDFTPYLLTADHCGITDTNDDTLVAYWNYESPTCGQLGGGSLAQNQTGAVLRAGWCSSVAVVGCSDDGTDVTLVELSQVPPSGFDVYYSGWDATGSTPQDGVCIHHPSGGEKSIAFQEDPMTTNPSAPQHWWVDDYELGTTEGGSSGSGMWDTTQGLLFGTLTGGTASCANPSGYDIFGKLSLGWEGGGTADTRLKDWLDPAGSGILTLQGSDPSGITPTECSPNATTLCLQSNRFAVTVDWDDQYNDRTGKGMAVPFADKTGFFWFFNEANIELVVKILDGTTLNGFYWVLYGALSDVEYTIRVTDTQTGATESYFNDPGSVCGEADTAAFEPKLVMAPLPGGAIPASARPVPPIRSAAETKVSAATCGNAFYDDGTAISSGWFDGGMAGDPDKMFAVLVNPLDFGFTPGQTMLTAFCAGNDLDWGGPWPNEIFIHPADPATGLPDDSVTLAQGTVYTGDGTGQYEVTVDPPVAINGPFWILNRGDAKWAGEDFNMDFDDGPNTGNSFISESGIAEIGVPVYSEHPDGVNYILRATLQATAQAPTAAFTWAPTAPVIGQNVIFTSTSTGEPTSFSWSFGDGGTSILENPSHSFAAAGTYPVQLTVSNSLGSDSVSHNVTVAEPNPEACVPDADTLCLLNGRFGVTVDWDDQYNDRQGSGTAVPRTDKTGMFWFFNSNNIELLVKVLDGRTLNGHFWVFYGALSDVEYWITVTDSETGAFQVYHNEPGNICGNADTMAF